MIGATPLKLSRSPGGRAWGGAHQQASAIDNVTIANETVLRVVKSGKAGALAPAHARGRLPYGPYRKEDTGKLTETEQREMRDREIRLASLQRVLD